MFTMKNTKYTKEQLEQACKESKSIRQVLNKLKLIEAGGNYSTIKARIKYYNIDTSHFTGKGWNVGGKFKPNPPKKLKEFLIENHPPYSSYKLKIRLIKEGYFEHKCYCCNNKTWRDYIIPLELEHINGKHNDNRIENLTLLCPNCHALTSTYRGKNQYRRGESNSQS